MQKTQMVSAGIAFVLAITFISHAQTIARAVQSVSATQPAPADSVVQMTAEEQGLERVAPEDLPQSGTF